MLTIATDHVVLIGIGRALYHGKIKTRGEEHPPRVPASVLDPLPLPEVLVGFAPSLTLGSSPALTGVAGFVVVDNYVVVLRAQPEVERPKGAFPSVALSVTLRHEFPPPWPLRLRGR